MLCDLKKTFGSNLFSWYMIRSKKTKKTKNSIFLAEEDADKEKQFTL
jgi:hypothetical protein